MNDDSSNNHQVAEFGTIVTGVVEAVFRWGIIVDIGLQQVGLIDALYIDDDDNYRVGQHISAYLELFDVKKNEYILRPPHQISLAERLESRDA